jgi:hypothetical protein
LTDKADFRNKSAGRVWRVGFMTKGRQKRGTAELVPIVSPVDLDDESVGSVILATFGAVLVLIALFLPLFTVHYAPPGGSAVLYGHRVDAFTETITGWQFATTARFTDLVFILGILLLPILALVLSGAEGLKVLSLSVLALFEVVVALGWLILLGIGLIENSLVMPYGGEKTILSSFHQDPFSTGDSQTLQKLGLNNPPTPHFYATFGVGFILFAIGIVLGLIGLWKWVLGATVLTVIVLVILRFADHALFNDVSGFLLAS